MGTAWLHAFLSTRSATREPTIGKSQMNRSQRIKAKPLCLDRTHRIVAKMASTRISNGMNCEK
jgi:hypothetical protein